MSTGIGADQTSFGCINSHYYDVTKPTPGGRGIFRTKQAGRTGIGSVMRDKRIRAIVVLADYPHGDNPLRRRRLGKGAQGRGEAPQGRQGGRSHSR